MARILSELDPEEGRGRAWLEAWRNLEMEKRLGRREGAAEEDGDCAVTAIVEGEGKLLKDYCSGRK